MSVSDISSCYLYLLRPVVTEFYARLNAGAQFFIFARILGKMCGLRIPDWLYGSKAAAYLNLTQNSCYVPIWDFLAMTVLRAHPVSSQISSKVRLKSTASQSTFLAVRNLLNVSGA